MQLLELVLRFLPLRDKLLQVTHLSHAFPPLTAGCFSEDGLKVDTAAVKARIAGSPTLQSLLSHLRQLTVCAERWSAKEWAKQPLLKHSARLPFSLSAFSRLQSLTIRLEERS
jgi:hypothetical protein